MSVQPFKVEIPQHTLDDLQERLVSTRWTDSVEGADWDYGANLAYIRELVAYWRNHFDWRAQEATLNQFSHFRADVDGFGIHFIYERGKGPHPLPIILTHGWPSTFTEMLKIIPMLTDPARYGGDPNDSFDVIVPSLPGYGFSDRPHQRGMNPEAIAAIWYRLMTQVLGYRRFAAHAGDMGRSVTQSLANCYPDSLYGIHLTDIGRPPFDKNMPGLSAAERQFFADGEKWGMTEGAYGMIQSTKPQSLAYGLNDSPAGLAAWIVEKFRAWSDCDGDVERRFTKDELLTNIMIYWVTETINSSMRLYYEFAHIPPSSNAIERSDVPAAFALFPKDLLYLPRELVERSFNVQRWTEMPRGGHFAPMEEPELLVEDIRAFFRWFR